MKQPKIIVADIGPGSEQDITPAVLSTVQEADVMVRYNICRNHSAWSCPPVNLSPCQLNIHN